MPLFITLLYIVFVLAAIILVVVVLLQEGQGGGFGGALGGAGEATFGVGASGINRFTGWVAVVFLVSALGIHILNRNATTTSVLDDAGGSMLSAPPAGDAPAGAPAGDQ
jgi:preprotein translocase subunit SecG